MWHMMMIIRVCAGRFGIEGSLPLEAIARLLGGVASCHRATHTALVHKLPAAAPTSTAAAAAVAQVSSSSSSSTDSIGSSSDNSSSSSSSNSSSSSSSSSDSNSNCLMIDSTGARAKAGVVASNRVLSALSKIASPLIDTLHMIIPMLLLLR